MWEVKFDNGETHKLAASWIELKLWSKSIEDKENDADDDDKEQPSGTQWRQVTCGNCGARATLEKAAMNSRRREGPVPRRRKRSGRPPLIFLKAVQVRFAAIGCLRARTVRLRELLRCCKFTTHV